MFCSILIFHVHDMLSSRLVLDCLRVVVDVFEVVVEFFEVVVGGCRWFWVVVALQPPKTT